MEKVSRGGRERDDGFYNLFHMRGMVLDHANSELRTPDWLFTIQQA